LCLDELDSVFEGACARLDQFHHGVARLQLLIDAKPREQQRLLVRMQQRIKQLRAPDGRLPAVDLGVDDRIAALHLNRVQFTFGNGQCGLDIEQRARRDKLQPVLGCILVDLDASQDQALDGLQIGDPSVQRLGFGFEQ